ncbi:PTS sugar transporter subunit IIA [Anaeromicropila herbilytica]|uniref:PTS EIIA type-1 domain-containing protein n=1 Tax=Anaeromicropila herbilytica TaxID=2785025 RepID=A0A7R7EM84_9FIRM|nr:PTS glucose transporter subunit IIA [Anaeromicropila herbilytica]BCN31334.1 hypothetical protein bsdtb5_26290 [Anaeromicropila herbilytica]
MGLFSKKKKEEVFCCPIKGRVASITETPDPAFAEKMMGDGIVIFPTDGVVYAPCDATVAFVFPTNHALGLKTDSEIELLIHVGIETVKLDGQGFKMLVNEGDSVKKGDKLLEFDLEYIKDNAESIATPFIVTNLNDKQTIKIQKTGDVSASEDIFSIV